MSIVKKYFCINVIPTDHGGTPTLSGPKKNDVGTLSQSDGSDIYYLNPFFLVHGLYQWKKRYYLS